MKENPVMKINLWENNSIRKLVAAHIKAFKVLTPEIRMNCNYLEWQGIHRFLLCWNPNVKNTQVILHHSLKTIHSNLKPIPLKV